MKLATLLYHDIVSNGQMDSSGFRGGGPDRYKLDSDDFDEHLQELSLRTTHAPVTAHELGEQTSELPWLLTFDDGGESALRIGERLAERGWRGHFFVTVDWIGKPGFVDEAAIRALDGMGHLIGSHSCSHPARMSSCSREELLSEWGESVKALSAILDHPVEVASVPGGYYRPLVARTAAAAGIRTLFNSEPMVSTKVVDGCLVVGRFAIRRGVSAQTAAELACGKPLRRAREFAVWRGKSVAKRIGGKSYLRLRSWLLSRN